MEAEIEGYAVSETAAANIRTGRAAVIEYAATRNPKVAKTIWKSLPTGIVDHFSDLEGTIIAVFIDGDTEVKVKDDGHKQEFKMLGPDRSLMTRAIGRAVYVAAGWGGDALKKVMATEELRLGAAGMAYGYGLGVAPGILPEMTSAEKASFVAAATKAVKKFDRFAEGAVVGAADVLEVFGSASTASSGSSSGGGSKALRPVPDGDFYGPMGKRP